MQLNLNHSFIRKNEFDEKYIYQLIKIKTLCLKSNIFDIYTINIYIIIIISKKII